MALGPVAGPSVGGVTGVAPRSDDVAAKALVNAARANLGWHEGYNNDNPYTQRVMGDRHQPWCAAYVSTLLKDANIPGISGRMWSAGCSQLASQFQQAGRYFPRGSQQPQPGDVIFFGGRGGEHHTGIVEKVENGKVYTIEGNSGDKVSERVYDLNSPGIGGYGRVFGGQVSADLGVDTSQAGQGGAGNAMGARAQGRGTATQAGENGIDPASYYNRNINWLIALLRAMSGDDPANVAAALEQMFPQVSKEDLGDVAKILKDNPKLAMKVAARPDLLQQLVADHSAEGVKKLLDLKLTRPETKAAEALLKQATTPVRGGWGPTEPAQAGSNGAWRPPTPEQA
jgi:hypothetical protein